MDRVRIPVKSKILLEKYLRRIGIRKRFLLIFILLSFMPMMFVGIITYNKSQSNIEDKVSKYCVQINTGIRTNFDNFFKKVDEETINIIYYNDIQELLAQYIKEEGNPNGNAYFLANDISLQLNRKIVLYEGILNATITTIKQSRINYDIENTDYRKKIIHDTMTKSFYQQAINQGGKLIWDSLIDIQDTKNTTGNKSIENGFQVARSFCIRTTGDAAGVISVLYNQDILKSTYSQVAGEGEFFLLDYNNRIVFSNKAELMNKKFPYSELIEGKNKDISGADGVYLKKISKENRMLTYSVSKVNGWGLVYLVPYSPFVKESQDFGLLIIGISFLLLLLSGITAYVFSSSISNPLKRLILVTKNVKDGNYSIRDRLYGDDEVTNLSLAFNEMIEKTEKLIKEVYETQLRENEFKLKALHAQINPHFLYNTLDNIRWIARKNKDYQVSKRIEMLSNLFRMILKDSETIITIDQEIKYTEYYLYFQKQSLNEALQIIWEVDNSVRDYKTPKLSLQPLIENCIIHGFQLPKEQLNIKIAIKDSSKNISIRIEDDGVGTEMINILNALDDKDDSKKSIGIRNVNERIKGYFGISYALEFYSEAGKGTVVTIEIPKKN